MHMVIIKDVARLCFYMTAEYTELARGVPFQTYFKYMDLFCQANIWLVEQL